MIRDTTTLGMSIDISFEMCTPTSDIMIRYTLDRKGSHTESNTQLFRHYVTSLGMTEHIKITDAWTCTLSLHLVHKAAIKQFVESIHYLFVDLPNALYTILSLKLHEVDENKLHNTRTYEKLRGYQKIVVRGLITRGGRAINMSEMGTGKTAVCVCFIEYYGIDDVLIVCPSSTRQNMANEIKRFSNQSTNIILNGRTPFTSGINIISFDLLRACPVDKTWSTIIVDESHYIKNRTSKRAVAVLKLACTAKYVLLMSGTPSSKPVDLYTQLKAIHPSIFRYFSSYYNQFRKNVHEFNFGDRYCVPTKTFIRPGMFKYTYDGCTRIHELYALLSILGERKKKDDVLTIPPKTRVVHAVHTLDATESGKQLKHVSILRRKKGQALANSELSNLVRAHARLKIPHIVAYLETLLQRMEPDKKFVIFAHHTKMLHAIRETCEIYNKKFIYIDGSTPVQRRQDLIDQFNAPNHVAHVSFAILSITACGVGLNVTGASHVIFTELLWCDKSMLQAEDRVHRSGQLHPVLIEYLITRHSMDDMMLHKISRKHAQSALTVDNTVLRDFV